MRTKQMTVFLCLLAASWIFDYRNYSFSHTTGTPEGLVILGSVLLFGCVLFNVGSVAATLLAAAVGLVVLVLDPHLSNHETLYGSVLLAVMCTWVACAVRERSRRVDAPRYDELLAVVLRLAFFAFYFWTAFQKWNDQFLAPATSCAAYQLEHLGDLLPLLPIPTAFVPIAGHATIVVELLIPALLLVPATRRLGVVLGLAFHTVLGIGFPAFQYLVFGFLLLFVPEAVWREVWGRVAGAVAEVAPLRLVASLLRNPVARGALGLALAVVSVEFYYLVRQPGSKVVFGQVIYPAFSLLMLGSIALCSSLLVLRSSAWSTAQPVPLVRRLPTVLWIFPVVIFLQGLQPHLGIKNVQAFAMFSNLDTDNGQSNHWVIPASWQIFSNLSEPVTIHEASHPTLVVLGAAGPNTRTVLRAARHPRLRPSLLELRRQVTRLAGTGAEGVMLDYSHAGVRRRVENAERDPLLANASVIERFYLKTRPLALNRHGACRW
jgi:hypothetical protein